MIFTKRGISLIIGFLTLFFTPIFVSAQVADFNADVTSGCPPTLKVHFTDMSTGNPTSWLWDFGNGNTSSLKNPDVVYTNPGSYTVSLTVSGGNKKTKSNFIVLYEKPNVAFAADVVTGCIPLQVKFTNTSTAGSGSITSNSWVLGDGDVSAEASPTHGYKAPAVFSVTLTVTNQHGCSNSLVKPSLIDALGAKVDFSSNQTNFCLAPATVGITNNTTGTEPITYQWDFGDQSNSTDKDPSHTYASPGNYKVTLSAKDGNGCTVSKSKADFVLIGNEPGVKFNLSSTKVCIGQTVRITNQTSVPVVSQSWDLGDGTVSSENNPTVVYKADGTYPVSLKVLLPSGCELVITKNVEVIKNPEPDFSIALACKQKVTFTNKSKEATTYSWDFGDNKTSTEVSPVHSYSGTGTFKVKLKAFNSLNCPVVLERDIKVDGDPDAAISPTEENSCTEPSLAGCAPFTIQFTNKTQSTLPLASTLWTFGDNTNSSSLSPSHVYTNAGTYNVRMIATNTLGCRDTAKVVVKVSNTIPKADFTLDKTVLCVGEPVTITYAFAAKDAEFLCWDFGDNNPESFKTADRLQTTHRYVKPGTYSVTLIAKNAGCTAVVVKTDVIKVNDPYLEYAVVKNCLAPYDITMVNNSANFDTFEWDFGDGDVNTSNSGLVQHHYQSQGSYDVKLTLTNNTTHCIVVEKKSIVIQEVKADFQPDANPVCKASAINFTDKSTAAKSWDWSFGSDPTDVSSMQNPTKAFTTPGVYNVRLRVADSENCTSSKTIALKVADIDGKFSFNATSTCTEFNVVFKDESVAFPAITKWFWEFGDGGTSTVQNPSHTYNQLDKYPVKVTLENSDAICTVLVSDAVVFTNPTVDFSVDKSLVCLNENVTFSSKATLAKSLLWDFGNNKTMTDLRPTTTYNQPGKYNVTLKAKDEYGCEVSVTKPASVEVSKPTARFEATQTSAECPPLITSFYDRSSSDVTDWYWDFGGGKNSVLQNPTFTYEIPGVYDVSLVVANKVGCTDKMIIEDLVFLDGPYGSFTASAQKICTDEQVFFKATTSNTSKLIWDFGDGVVLETDQTEVTHPYVSQADVNLSLTLVDSKGCKVVVDKGKKISVKGRPKIDFEFESDYSFEDDTVLFTAITEEQLNLLWTFDESTKSGGTEMKETFSHYGTYLVTLKAADSDGCDSVVEKEVHIQGKVDMIPNVFTPNDDKFNNTFIINKVEHGSWRIKIYNRWGQLVYSNSEYQSEWGGRDQSTGVYYYTLINNYHPEKHYKGYVQILK